MSYPAKDSPRNLTPSQTMDILSVALSRTQQSGHGPKGAQVWQRPDGDWEFASGPLPGERGARGAEAPLGIKRGYFHPGDVCECGNHRETQAKPANPAQRIRRDAWADQRQAASIYWSYREKAQERAGPFGDVEDLAGRGVTFCGHTQIADVEAELWRTKRQGRIHAYETGRQMCGLRWVCPVCTAKRAEEDRRLVNAALAGARKRKLYPVMLTLTTRHTKKEAAQDVLAGVIEAEQRLKRLKVWTRLRGRTGGYARVLEWTYGKNGHHPHFHTILLVQAGSETEAIEAVDTLQPAYMRQLAAAGRDGTSRAAWRHSFQVQGAAAAEGYIVKWGSAEELTGAQKKQAAGEGLTPWQLLRLSRTLADERERARHAAVWWEIIQATQGKAQLYKSQDFTAIAEEWLAEQPEPDEPEEPERVASFGIRQKGQDATPRFKLARKRTLAIREAAENHADLKAAEEAVEVALRSETDVELFGDVPDDPGPLIEPVESDHEDGAVFMCSGYNEGASQVGDSPPFMERIADEDCRGTESSSH